MYKIRKYISVFMILCIALATIQVGAEENAINTEQNEVAEIKNSEKMPEVNLTKYTGSMFDYVQIWERNSISTISEDEDMTSSDDSMNLHDTFTVVGEYPENEISLMSVSENDYSAFAEPSYRNAIKHPKINVKNEGSDYVSPFDGSLQLNYTDISLPGRNGLDLNLGHFYQSEHGFEEIKFENGRYITAPVTYFNKRYALGLGWSLAFPSVELRKKPDGEYQTYYHDGRGNAYRSNYKDSTKNDAGEDYYNGYLIYSTNLDNYYTDNVTFREKDRSYSRDGVKSEYSFKRGDNTKEYFANDGRLISIKDRFDNEIKFDYDFFPGENFIPFYTCDQFTLGSKWYTNGSILTFDGNSTSSTSVARTQYAQLDELCDSYYVSLLYEAASSGLSKFEGNVQVYCDIYSGESQLLDSILIDEVSPDVYEEAFQIEGNIYLDDYDFTETPEMARIRIVVEDAKNDIAFTDVRLSPYRPLMTKITDTIGRTIEFDYHGDLYTRYATSTSYPIHITAKSPSGDIIKEMTYFRRVRASGFEYGGVDVEKQFHYVFKGNNDGEVYYNVSYEYMSGGGCQVYLTSGDAVTYTFSHRPVVDEVRNRNTVTEFEYENVCKWVDMRPKGSNEAATVYNTGYFDTFRVVKKYYVNQSDPHNGEHDYNVYSYYYQSGYYSDETAYTRRKIEYLNLEPGYLNPEGGSYIVKVTNPNGSIETYEYTSHIFDDGFRLKWEISLPLLDKKIVAESSSDTADTVVTEYTYDDNYALVSPTEIKTSETVNGTTRVYYNKVEYDSDSCLPVLNTYPLTEDEFYDIPEEKTITTEYKKLSNRMFLPERTTYYRSAGGEELSSGYTYDELGRVESETNAKGDTVNYEYDGTYKWLPAKVYFNDPENIGDTERLVETTYKYQDSYGLGPTQKKMVYNARGDVEITKYEYEPKYGQVSKMTAPDGGITRYEYDAMGRPLIIYYPSYKGTSWQKFYPFVKYEYDDIEYDGKRLFYVHESIYATPDASYVMTDTDEDFYDSNSYYYDDHGKLHYSYTDMKEKYIYDSACRLIGYKNGEDYEKEGNTATYTYDGFDRVVSVADYNGNTQNAVYESLSVNYSFTPADGIVSENHYSVKYDIYGNAISESVYPSGLDSEPLTTTYEYDLLGNQTKLTDAAGRKSHICYDVVNNPIEVTRADDSKISYEYTKWNTVKSITRYDDNREYTIRKTFDNRGFPVSHRQVGLEINTEPWYYGYNEIGELSYSISPNGSGGEGQCFYYDLSGNNTISDYSAYYDEKIYDYYGRLIAVLTHKNGKEDFFASNAYEYGYRHNYPTYVFDDYSEVNYNYNNVGDLKYIRYAPDSLRVSYERDDLNHIYEVETSDSKSFFYDYYDDGMIKSLTYPEGNIVTSYTYDNANRLTKLETKSGEAVLKTYSYQYDKTGNIISVSGSESAEYSYDELNRIKTVAQNGITSTYEYDGRDNLIKETRSDGYIKTYEYSGDNRLEKTIEDETETVYEYDLNGNLIKRGEDIFAYDNRNNLVYTKIDGVETNFDVDHTGLRRRKRTGDQRTVYTYDVYGNQIIENDDSFIVCGNKPIARKIGDSYYYYIYNAHGDVVMIVDESGNVKNTYQYDVWGSVVSETETVENNHKYAGQYHDEDTGLIYLRARYYDPNDRRFTQEDPIRDELNWYAYCSNNPVMFVDPWGLYELVYGNNGEVYAVIESGDTLSAIAQAEVNDANAYTKMNYSGNYNQIDIGDKIEITGIYNKDYPNPNPSANVGTAIDAKKTSGRIGAVLYTTNLQIPLLFPELNADDYFMKDKYTYALISYEAVQNVKEFEKEIDELTYSLALATKSDLKQIEQVCKKMGIKGIARREFGDFLESMKKAQGKPGNVNFTWKELIEYAKEFLE